MPYKSDKHRIEDAIIPFILFRLFVSQAHQTDKSKEFEKAIDLVSQDIDKNITSIKLRNRLQRVSNKALQYFRDWPCRKAHMVISYLVASLVEEEAIILGEGTKEVITDINETIVNGYNEIDGLDKQDKSAAKHVPKFFKLLQDEGLFV